MERIIEIIVFSHEEEAVLADLQVYFYLMAAFSQVNQAVAAVKVNSCVV